LLTIIPRSSVIAALSSLRREWTLAVDGESLIEVETSVGLLLADLVTGLGLTQEEQVQVLGVDLANELKDVLIPVPGDNGYH
jgi:hypothetical protein